MIDLLHRREVLKLNMLHQPMDFFAPKDIFVEFANYKVDRRQNYILDSKGRRIRKMKGYDVEYAQLPDGSYNFEEIIKMDIVDWDDWIKLPVRPYDLVVHTPRYTVRVPRIVISLLTEDMPKDRYNTSLRSIYARDEGICQYSRKKITLAEASRDHIIAQSKGGKTELNNLLLCHKDINNLKGDKLASEVGLPDVRPVATVERYKKDTLVNYNDVPEWRWILKNKKK